MLSDSQINVIGHSFKFSCVPSLVNCNVLCSNWSNLLSRCRKKVLIVLRSVEGLCKMKTSVLRDQESNVL